MNQNIEANDEINLKDIFLMFWQGKIYIILFSLIAVLVGSLKLQDEVRKYTVTYKLKPVAETQKPPRPPSFGGLASIAGFELPTNTSADFIIFKELIFSPEVSGKVFDKNKDLMKKIYASEWNAALNHYSKPPQSKIQARIRNVKKLLTGSNDLQYLPPGGKRLSSYLAGNIRINEDKDTGFIVFSSETSSPEMILKLIIDSAELSDQIMRQRYIEFSAGPLAFYKDKLRTARSREHRESLAELISAEEQKLMFASKGEYFIAEPYIQPTISLYPTSPIPKNVLIMSLIVGILMGISVILIKSVITKAKS